MPDEQRGKIASLWASEYTRFRRSRDRIDVCGQYRRREIRPHIPDGWENPEAFYVELPHPTTLGQDVVNFLGRKRPTARRSASGNSAAGPEARRLASKVEQFVQAAMDEALKANGEDLWEANLAFSCNDGEWAVLVQPRPKHWANLLKFTDDTEDGAGNPVINPTFQRDAQGRTKDDAYYTDAKARFKVSRRKSADAYAEYAREAKAKKLPIVVRLLPGAMAIPIGLDPTTGRVDALLVKSRRTAVSLKKDGFAWTMLGPEVPEFQTGLSNALSGSGITLTLYELWVGGQVAYEIEGGSGQAMNTTLNGQEAVVDLEAEYGICQVPGGYFFGAHFANETDPAQKGIPFLAPFLGLIRGANQTATAKVAHAFRWAFSGKALKLDKELLGAWKEIGHPASFTIKPMELQVVPGDVQDLCHPGTNKDVDEIISLTTGTLNSMTPSRAIDTSGADSGFQGAVQSASADHMLRQVKDGAVAAWECIAENVCEQSAAISRMTKQPVPVFVTVKPKAGSNQPEVTTILEISSDDFQGDYEVDAILPTPRFSNLPLMQAGSVFVKDGLIPRVTWLEEMAGFEQPEEQEDLLWVQHQLDSPEGEQYILDLAKRKRGNQELQKLADLRQQGKVGPGGTPTLMMPPRPMSATGIGGERNNGPNTGNPAQLSVAATMAGQSMTRPQSNVIQATGQPAETAA
jgi:hypothetical protein